MGHRYGYLISEHENRAARPLDWRVEKNFKRSQPEEKRCGVTYFKKAIIRVQQLDV